MNSRIKLKRMLKNYYEFKRLLSDKEIRSLQKENPKHLQMQPAAVLVAGCVKIEVTIYRQDGKVQLGYDVFVKDTPSAAEWICYDSPTDAVRIKEHDMLSVLDRVVRENGLSYTECNFETVKGKQVKPYRKTDGEEGSAE